MDRRTYLSLGGGALCSLSGCLLRSEPVPGGALVVRNHTDRERTLTVAVAKTSDDDRDIPTHSHRAEPSGTPVWKRTDVRTVAADARRREDAFLTEPGAYYVAVEDDAGRADDAWIGLYPAGPDGEQLAESYLHASVHEERLSVGAVTLD